MSSSWASTGRAAKAVRMTIAVSVEDDILTIRIPLGEFARQSARELIEEMSLPQFLRALGIEPD
jgi:hypothetical protein